MKHTHVTAHTRGHTYKDARLKHHETGTLHYESKPFQGTFVKSKGQYYKELTTYNDEDAAQDYVKAYKKEHPAAKLKIYKTKEEGTTIYGILLKTKPLSNKELAKKEAKTAAHATGEYAKKEYGAFKGWLAKKKEERAEKKRHAEEEKKIKEEVGTNLETYN